MNSLKTPQKLQRTLTAPRARKEASHSTSMRVWLCCLRRRCWISRRGLERTWTRTMWRRRGAWYRALRRFLDGCMACSSCWGGTKRWWCCSIPSISRLCAVLLSLRKFPPFSSSHRESESDCRTIFLSYIIVKLGLAGPIYNVIRSMTTEVQHQATERLRQQFATPQLTEPMSYGNGTRVVDSAADEFDDDRSGEMRRRRAQPL